MGFAGERQFAKVVVAMTVRAKEGEGLIPTGSTNRLKRTPPVRGKPNVGGNRIQHGAIGYKIF
jgi:hypothetical protein